MNRTASKIASAALRTFARVSPRIAGWALACAAAAAVAVLPAAAAVQTVALSVPGMDCPVCLITVKKALGAGEGVKNAVVDFRKRLATVAFNDARTSVGKLTHRRCRPPLFRAVVTWSATPWRSSAMCTGCAGPLNPAEPPFGCRGALSHRTVWAGNFDMVR